MGRRKGIRMVMRMRVRGCAWIKIYNKLQNIVRINLKIINSYYFNVRIRNFVIIVVMNRYRWLRRIKDSVVIKHVIKVY